MVQETSFSLSGKVWIYPGPHSTSSLRVRASESRTGQAGGWHFVSLPKKVSGQIRKSITEKRPWGYVKVRATIGNTSWQTGLWPQAKEGVYLLVIKALVRHKEGIREGDMVRGKIVLL